MKRQFFSGNSLEQAVMAAARQFGIDPERVAYTQLEKRHGFLKVRRRVVIEVDGDAPELPSGAKPAIELDEVPSIEPPEFPAPDPFLVPADDDKVDDVVDEEEEDWVDDYDWDDDEEEDEDEDWDDDDLEDSDDEAHDEEPPRRGGRSSGRRASRDEDLPERGSLSETASVERAVREVLRFLDVRAEIQVERRDEVFEVEILDPEPDVLIDDEGKVLQSIEYLAPRIARNFLGRGVPVKVDCDGFRAEREQELRDLALEVADEVRDEGEDQLLDPMSPADRRLIHLALVDEPDVETESEGRGYYKRVRILPAYDSLDDSRG